MYVKGQASNALKKFYNYVTEYQKNLKNQQIKVEEQLYIRRVINDIKTKKDYDLILKNQDALIKFDNSLESKFKIIGFLVKNNATNAEQFKIVMDDILNSIIMSAFDNHTSMLLISQKQINSNLEQCNLIINDAGYDYDYYVKLLDVSGLSEKEKLDILSEHAFRTISIESQITSNVESQLSNDQAVDNIEKSDNVSSDKVEDRFEQVMTVVNDMITKYYYLIEKQNSNQLNYKKQYINAMRDQSGQVDFSVLESIEERLTLIMLEMIENKQLIEKEIQEIVNHEITKEDEDVINLFIDALEHNLQLFQETAKQFELDNCEENNVEPSKILFLLDEQGNPYIEAKEGNLESGKRIKSLIEKLEKGSHDYERGIKHSKILTDNKNDNIYVNRSSNMACSYMRLTKDIVLVLAINDFKVIYDLSKALCSKNRKVINSYFSLSENELEKLIQAQDNMVNNIYESLSVKGDAKK